MSQCNLDSLNFFNFVNTLTVSIEPFAGISFATDFGLLGHKPCPSPNLTINHSTNFLNPDDPSINTQKVERFWRSLEESVPKGANGKHREDHYFSYLFRRCFLREENDGQKFAKMLTYIKHQFPGLLNQEKNQVHIDPNDLIFLS